MPEALDTLMQEALRYGLTRFSESHLVQFCKAQAAAARLVGSVPRDVPVTVEPAHTFRASKEA